MMHYQHDALVAGHAYAALDEAIPEIKVDNRAYAIEARSFFDARGSNGPAVPVVAEVPYQPMSGSLDGAYNDPA